MIKVIPITPEKDPSLDYIIDEFLKLDREETVIIDACRLVSPFVFKNVNSDTKNIVILNCKTMTVYKYVFDFAFKKLTVERPYKHNIEVDMPNIFMIVDDFKRMDGQASENRRIEVLELP